MSGTLIDNRRTTGIVRALLVTAMMALPVALSGCAETQFLIHTAKRVTQPDQPAAGGGTYKIGKPYQIEGVWYYPKEDFEYDETGIASWYGVEFHGRATANGEAYDMNALTAAHRTLPMPSFVRVTNLENGRSVVLKVNDRGPFAKSRIIDLSRRSAQLLGYQNQGTARVRVQILADQSRVVAVRLQNQDQLARIGTPITVDRLPKASVSSESMPAPEGANSSPVATAPVPAPTSKPSAPVTLTRPVETAAVNPVDQEVRQELVKPTKIFIQAGAFGRFDNADRVRAKLAALGNVFLDQVVLNDRDLYRVRVGPIANVAEADHLLGRVIATGYGDAKIIVD